MNMNNDGDATMMESALQNAPEEFCKRMEEVRNDSLDTRCTFQNTMLNVVMVFLGLSIPMFCAFSFNKFINACMGIGIVSGMIAAGMLIITQYKLLRQKEETVNKMLLALFRQKATGLFSSSTKSLEEFCSKYWMWPFYMMSASCVLAVLAAVVHNFSKA